MLLIRKILWPWAACFLAASVFLPTFQGRALAAVSEAEATDKLETSYGVRVLKVRSGEIDGRKVWLVTVMNPGGNSNAAFQVNTLAVDKESGELVPSFRHGASGYVLPEAAQRDDRLGLRPEVMRSRTWR